jgi:hypothetical protein
VYDEKLMLGTQNKTFEDEKNAALDSCPVHVIRKFIDRSFIGIRSPEKLWRGQFASRRAVSKRVIMHLDAIVVEPKLSTNVIDFGQNLADPKGSSENLLFRLAGQFSAKKLLKYCLSTLFVRDCK